MKAWHLALLGSSLLLAVAIVELALRALGIGAANEEAWRVQGFHQPDPDLVYSMIPGAQSTWATSGFVEETHTNSLGLRGPELEDRATGARRIVILGDSMTFGHGVSADQAYPAQLQKIFEDRGARVEVVNAGVKGYGSDHHLKHFEKKLRALDPDIVVFSYYVNDLEDNVRYPLYDIADGELVEVDPTANPLYRLGRIQQAIPGFLRQLRIVQVLGSAYAGEPPPIAPPSTRAQEAWSKKKLLLALARMNEYASEDGFGFIVLGLPYQGDSRDRYRWLRNSDRGGGLLLDQSRDPIWRTPRSPLFLEGDPHLSAEGHARIAQQLDEFMTQRRHKLRESVR